MEEQTLIVQKNEKLLYANRVHVIHGLFISALESSLTLRNTILTNAYSLDSFNKLVYFGSALMEFVSFLYSIYKAIYFYNNHNNSDYDDLVSIGVPIMSLGENAFKQKHDDNEIWSDSAYLGLVLQSISFLFTVNCSLFIYIYSLESIDQFDIKCLVFIVFFLIIMGFSSYRAMFGKSGFFLLLLFFIPFMVDIVESVLLFSTDTEFESYILAIIDIFVIIPSSIVVINHVYYNKNINAINSLWEKFDF